MCGIAGFIKFDSKLSKKELISYSKKMSKTLQSRGPDAQGQWYDENYGVSISHRRLSIIDLSKNANQPFISSDRRYVIVYNGEIYNFKQIRTDLQARGLKFKTNSDTEVLLELISLEGIHKAVESLNGMFSFAVWDKKLKKLFVVRDRVGIKPLYIYYDNKIFSFASELKAFWKLPWINLELDRESIATYVRLNYIPSPYSIYKNVSKLKPGSILEISMSKKIKISEFFSLTSFKSRKEYFDLSDTYEVLSSAVRKQMISDVPLGVFLSGGVDSSLIAAIAQENTKKKINSFTIGFSDNDFDEAVFARKVSKEIGTHHNEVYFDNSSIEKIFDKLPTIYDEPFADSSQLPTILLSQITKKGVTVALSGDGADELFGGYYRYFLATQYNKYIFEQPRILKKFLEKTIKTIPNTVWNKFGNVLPNYFGGSQLGDKLLKLSNLLSDNSKNSFQKRIISNYDDLLPVLISPEEKLINYFDNKYNDNTKENIIQQMQYLDFTTYLPDDILTKVDRASMHNSLEVRVPFLDNEVIEHALNMPIEKKVKSNKGKIILKEILKKFLPNNLINRPKMGFGIPLDKILIKSFSSKIEYFLNSKEIENQKIFNLNYFRKLWKEHKSLERNWQFQLWNFLIFQSWYEKWHSSKKKI